jgi:transcriptional regulator with XRE-family HTH domain
MTRRDRSSRAIVHAQALGNVVNVTGHQSIEPSPLGYQLAEARTACGMSARGLAAAIGAAPSTVTRIERGERRVSPAMLACLAAALSPDDPEQLRTVLTSAAGPLLVEDTPGGVRRRERRMRKAQRAVRRERNRQAVADFRQREAMQREAARMSASAYRMLDDPDGDLDQVDALMAGAKRLRAAAGPPIGAIHERQLVASIKTFGRAASQAAGNGPQQKRPRKSPPPPPSPPARDGSASEREILAYIRRQAEQELGVEYE